MVWDLRTQVAHDPRSVLVHSRSERVLFSSQALFSGLLDHGKACASQKLGLKVVSWKSGCFAGLPVFVDRLQVEKSAALDWSQPRDHVITQRNHLRRNVHSPVRSTLQRCSFGYTKPPRTTSVARSLPSSQGSTFMKHQSQSPSARHPFSLESLSMDALFRFLRKVCQKVQCVRCSTGGELTPGVDAAEANATGTDAAIPAQTFVRTVAPEDRRIRSS